MYPTLFISHGSPALCIEQYETAEFLKKLSQEFSKPKYIIIISAHWCTKDLRILSKMNPDKINDFYGFPQELFDKKYPARNDLNRVEKIVNKFEENNISIIKDENRSGYDHGVWAPLSLMYPNADIPIIQISLPIFYSAKELMKIGEVLQDFRIDSLIIGSGTLTHNLKNSVWDSKAPVQSYAKEFRDWMIEKLEKLDIYSLENFISLAPKLTDNHPTLDHLLPLFIAVGASKTKKVIVLNNIYMYGNQAMDTIIFKD